MTKTTQTIRSNVTLFAGLLVTAALMSILQNRAVFFRDLDADVLLRLRGSRMLDSRIRLIYLDEADIEALGGWPITRDYYSYTVHVLTALNAKTIGLDVWLNTEHRQYPEYDRMLAEFLKSSQRVVLPSVIDFSDSMIIREKGPIHILAQAASEIGFSNLSESVVQRYVPIVSDRKDDEISFGLALAKTYFNADIECTGRRVLLKSESSGNLSIPVDDNGTFWLNPAGCVSQIKGMRFTHLLKMFEKNPDSLDFSGQLVVVAPIAPSLPLIQSTSLCSRLPASLIHATVAENIIRQNWLRRPPFMITLMWLLFWLAAGIFAGLRIRRRLGLWLCLPGAGLVFLAWMQISLLYVVVPITFSLMLFWVSAVSAHRLNESVLRHADSARLREIETQIRLREEALEKAEQRLSEVESQLNREITEKAQLSNETKRQVRDQEKRVLELEKQIRDLNTAIQPEPSREKAVFPELIHMPDGPFSRVLEMVLKAAPDDIPVLIQGETGTGKELVAKAIHQASRRKRKPFIAINCGALPESLLESELFGHEKGAFTGAHARRRGRFELARGGTVLLDEITETSPAFQARLLRVLQEGTFERLGSERTLNADVRVIAAHNKDLPGEVREGRFREDLFFRLNAFPIDLPPLRERAEDIPLLAGFFIRRYQKSGTVRMSDAAQDCLMKYRWPGNVRELENMIRRSVLLAESESRRMIQLKDLPKEVRKVETLVHPTVYHSLESQILETLRGFRFSHAAISQTARALGNKDRGTVTEYFRGLCFQFLVQNESDPARAAGALAASDDPDVIARVEGKLRGYVENVRQSVQENPSAPSCYKGLPKKFHPFLDRIVQEIREERA